MLTISAVVCFLGTAIILLARSATILAAPLFGFSRQSPESSTQHVLQEPFSLSEFYGRVPYASSWGSWLHPERMDGVRRIQLDDALGGVGSGQGGGEVGHDWNILYHLGGNGPWIEKVDGVVKGGIGVPEGCRVGQIHMVRPDVHKGIFRPRNFRREGVKGGNMVCTQQSATVLTLLCF